MRAPAARTVYVVMPGCEAHIDPERARRRSSDVHGRTLAPGDRIVDAAGFGKHPAAPAILRELRAFSEPRLMRDLLDRAEERRRILLDLGIAS